MTKNGEQVSLKNDRNLILWDRAKLLFKNDRQAVFTKNGENHIAAFGKMVCVKSIPRLERVLIYDRPITVCVVTDNVEIEVTERVPEFLNDPVNVMVDTEIIGSDCL